MAVNDDNNILMQENRTPLGCAAPSGTTDETCYLKLYAINDDGSSGCSDADTEFDKAHEHCGFTVIGLTKYGLEIGHNYYNPRNLIAKNHYENGTYVHETIGTHIKMQSSSEEVESGTAYLNMAVMENPTGHHLWDNYITRNVEVDGHLYINIF